VKTLAHIRRFIWSRALPKTGQIISYVDDDDGYNEFGWWRGLYNVDNKNRFIEKTIGGDDVVIDLATGLMWAADGNAAGCNNGSVITWANAISYCETLSFAGLSDWYLPNIKELLSIADFGLQSPAIKEPPFSNTVTDYWSSTTNISSTTYALKVSFAIGLIVSIIKTGTMDLRACRIL